MLAVCGLLLSALCLRAELAFKWTVEVSQPLPYAADALQGETFNLEAKVVQYRVPMLEAAEATFYYQTPEMEASQWYTVPAAWDATTATASVAFTPALDVGSTKYRFFFGIETAQGKNYRVFGTLRLKASPGFSPATLTPTDVRAEIIQEILKAVFEESDERYATKAEHAALAVQVQGKADASHTHTIAQVSNLQAQLDAKAATSTVSALTTRLTIAEAAIEEVADAKQDKLTMDSTLSASSTNPVQNQAVKAALDKKAEKSHTHTISQVTNLQTQLSQLDYKASKSTFNSDDIILPYVKANGASMHALRTVFDANNDADNWAEKFDNAKLTFEWWHQYDNVKEDSFDVPMKTFRELAASGGGHTEVWRGNVGFGEQDTFFGPRKVADGEGQFLNGYPRLHNHGQDIHEVSGFSRDSRDDETVWSHRLLLPWDLAKANDTSYLLAGVVWESTRLGVNTRFVQPLLPTNTPEATSALGLPYALPCFENSPIYWNGHLIFSDDGASVKQVQIPWDKIANGQTARLALEGESGGGSLTMERNDSTKEISIYDGSSDSYIGVFRVAQDGTFKCNYKDTQNTFKLPKAIDSALSATSTNPVQNKAIKAALDTTAAVSFGSMPSVSLSKDGKCFNIQSADDVGMIGAEITYPNGTKVVLVKSETVMDLATRVNALESAAPSEPEARTSNTLSWQANTSLLTVTPNADGAVVFDPTGWPEGQSLLVRLTTPEDFGGVPASVRLVGYFDLEPASTYQLTAYVVGGTLHVVPLLREE